MTRTDQMIEYTLAALTVILIGSFGVAMVDGAIYATYATYCAIAHSCAGATP